TDHLGECVHETGGISACQHDQDPLITELPDVFYSTGVDPPVPVGEGAIDIGDEPLQHCLSPASSTMKGASPSGRFGLSTSRAIRLPPLLFRRKIGNVAVCPTMFPPMGLVGSPKKTAGFESTWLVTRPTALFSSASLKRSWRCRFSFCCRAARVPRPAYSALK